MLRPCSRATGWGADPPWTAVGPLTVGRAGTLVGTPGSEWPPLSAPGTSVDGLRGWPGLQPISRRVTDDPAETQRRQRKSPQFTGGRTEAQGQSPLERDDGLQGCPGTPSPRHVHTGALPGPHKPGHFGRPGASVPQSLHWAGLSSVPAAPSGAWEARRLGQQGQGGRRGGACAGEGGGGTWSELSTHPPPAPPCGPEPPLCRRVLCLATPTAQGFPVSEWMHGAAKARTGLGAPPTRTLDMGDTGTSGPGCGL